MTNLIAEISIPTTTGTFKVEIETGRSLLFVGANGAGKTRLGVFVEEHLASHPVRRIAAHRSLTMSDKLQTISYERAMRALDTGYPDQGGNRMVHKYQQQPAIIMMNDYEHLLQALFSDQSRTAIEHLEKHRANSCEAAPETTLSKLARAWERLLPHRKLHLLELGVQVLLPGQQKGEGYNGSQMSDGERVIFYLLGQSFLAPAGSVVIIDEPELHIHKAILGRLWDAIESQRSDCCFVYITHDLDFLISRPTASKFVVESYCSTPSWEITKIESDTNLPSRVVAELIGSRQPILFVEGDRGSIDATIYRAVYSEFLIQPIGGCQDVIHAVRSFNNNSSLHNKGPARGCIDSDSRSPEDIAQLLGKGVYTLPVAEMENVFLLSRVFSALANSLHFAKVEIDRLHTDLNYSVMVKAEEDAEAASVRYAIRRIDASMKRLALSSSQVIIDLGRDYRASISTLDPEGLANSYMTQITTAVQENDLTKILKLYDNKGLLSMAARILGLQGRQELTEFAGRLLAYNVGNSLMAALKAVLPTITLT